MAVVAGLLPIIAPDYYLNDQYSMEFDPHHMREFERLAERLLQMLSDANATRTRDCVQIDYLGERGVVILLTPQDVEVRLPTIDWTQGSHGPVASSVLKRRHRIGGDESEIIASIMDAIDERQAQFQVCPHCKEEFPPEHMAAGSCHGCASTHLGIVF